MVNAVSLFLISLLLMNSCAWNKDLFKSKRKKAPDLVEEFNIKKVDKEKFAVTPVDIADKPTKEEEKKIPKIKVQSKSLKKRPPKVKKKIVKSEKKISKKHKITGVEYPEEYPKEFISYDIKSKKVWDDYTSNIYIGEEYIFEVKYFGVTAGKIFLKVRPNVMVGEHAAHHFHARMISAPFYRYIYELDDEIETYVKTDGFYPLKYSLKQRESKQTVDDLQLFEREKFMTHVWYKKLKKGKLKKEEHSKIMPYYSLDSFSPLFFIRGLELNKGVEYQFPIVTRGKTWLLKFENVATETIKVMKKDVSAIRVKAETSFPGVLKKKGDILFWFSNDEEKKLLKFEAKVKIGTVEGITVDYKSGKK